MDDLFQFLISDIQSLKKLQLLKKLRIKYQQNNWLQLKDSEVFTVCVKDCVALIVKIINAIIFCMFSWLACFFVSVFFTYTVET